MPRTRLRSRLFAITALHAAMLIGIVWTLTWRARESNAEFNRLIAVDARVISRIDDLVRGVERVRTSVASSAEHGSRSLPPDAGYEASKNVLSDGSLTTEEANALRSDVESFEKLAEDSVTGWGAMSTLDRTSALRQLDEVTSSIEARAQAMIMFRKREVDRRLALLERDANDTMWVALGIAWMIAIVSFAIARMTLARVVTPLEDLSRAAERIESGELSARVRVRGDREIAHLSHSFNRMAAEIASSHAELQAQATTDGLTGMPNFRTFRAKIDEQIEYALRYEENFGVLIFDLDHFKKYNDKYGHLAGNEALRAVASAIREGVRHVDTAARYGGEEFAVVLPKIDAAGLALIAERVRARIEAIPPIDGRRKLTVSVGGALFPADGATADSLFKVADVRLYEAKSAGRNRVVSPESAAASS